MAGTAHQLWNIGLVNSSEEEEEYKHKKHPHNCLYKPMKYHLRRRIQAQKIRKVGRPAHPLARDGDGDGELFDNKEKVFHDKTLRFNDHGTDFVALLHACAKDKDLYKGISLHDEILKRGILKKCLNPLAAMYAKCGALSEAKELLYVHKSRDVFSWTTLIAAYAQQGQSQNALSCFERMQQAGLSPDAVTFACILKACGSLRAAEKGEQIHEEIAGQGFLENNIMLGTALVDMYAKCGALSKAQQVLKNLSSRNVTSWNALIAGYTQQGQGEQALSCFEEMQREGLSPSVVTFTCILKACGSIGAADKGKQIHEEIVRQGMLGNDIVLGTSLMDMYIKCGDLSKAQGVLNQLPSRDTTSWNALITGYGQQGQGEKAFDCFEQMQREGISPNAMTFSCILKACSSIGDIDKGKQIHDQIARQGLLGKDVVLGTALVDMYAKCGDLAKAARVLQELPSRNATSWNALITGYSQQGQGQQALNCFERMQLEGLTPNAVTFLCVLNVCSHLGMVEYGHMYFVDMSTKYGVNPELEHYSCMVDLFGRAGHLDKAVGVIQGMPSSHYSAGLSTLLGACRKWGDVKVGRWAFEHAVQVNKSDALPYVLMADMYAAAGMQKDAEIIEAMRMANKAWKRPEQVH